MTKKKPPTPTIKAEKPMAFSLEPPAPKAARSKPQSAGGIARAEALSEKERTDIAKKGALARWSGEKALPVVAFGAADKPLKIGDIEIPCYVLADGRRVLATRGLQSGIGLSEGGGTRGARRMAVLMASLEKKGLDIKDLVSRIDSPIGFVTPNGATAVGYEATILPDICAVVIEAARGGKLQKQQGHIAERCGILQHGFATVGIIALVDEAAGYQAVRPQDALAKYLEAILRKELAAWVKRFPDEFYENIYRLRGWHWPGMGVNRYSVVAQYTRDLVYERIAPTLLAELEKKSPKKASGGRKNKLHQWLTDEVGHPLLAQHLHSIVMFQRLAIANGHGWSRFIRMVDQVLPKKGQTLELPLTGLD